MPAFAADRYALDVDDSRARSGTSVSCSRAGSSRNSEIRSSAPSCSASAAATSSADFLVFVAAAACAFSPDSSIFITSTALDSNAFLVLVFAMYSGDFLVSFAALSSFRSLVLAVTGVLVVAVLAVTTSPELSFLPCLSTPL